MNITPEQRTALLEYMEKPGWNVAGVAKVLGVTELQVAELLHSRDRKWLSDQGLMWKGLNALPTETNYSRSAPIVDRSQWKDNRPNWRQMKRK